MPNTPSTRDQADIHKHLDFLQATIVRMAGNSFQIKAWGMGFATAILAFASRESDPAFLWVAFLPALVLWGLDAYFLKQERLFRALYDLARDPESTVPIFSMDTRVIVARNCRFRSALFSRTLLSFHGIIVAVILLAMWLLGIF